MKAMLVSALMLVLTATTMPAPQVQLQAATRKIILSSPPEYPELARRMNIRGVARVLLTVAPNGKVTGIKDLGGHPILLQSLADAVKKWRYEADVATSSIEVRFEFK